MVDMTETLRIGMVRTVLVYNAPPRYIGGHAGCAVLKHLRVIRQ